MSANTVRKELAHRCTDGVNVWLFWDSVGDTLTLEVYDGRTDEFFCLEIPRDCALDAFHHPYAYRERVRTLAVVEPAAA
jgi:hypothetical protein